MKPLVVVAFLLAATLTTSVQLAKRCGLSRIQPVSNRNSSLAEENEFPWMVSLQRNVSKKYNHFCGASIIAEHWVLTTAHCLNDLTVRNLYSIAGFIGSNQLNSASGKRIFFDHFIIHDHYNPQTFRNDIALLHTDEPIRFKLTSEGFRVNSICLASPALFADLPAKAVVSGWGRNDTDSWDLNVMNDLMKTSLDLVDRENCREIYREMFLSLGENEICYGLHHKDTCQGDSGGPLMRIFRRRTFLIGLISYGLGCGLYPGVYTNVARYSQWITTQMNQYNQHTHNRLFG